MLRAVLAVALAAALLAVSLPVVEDARRDHAGSRVRSELRGVERAARALAADSDPVPVGAAGARRSVTVRLPARGWHAAPVAFVAVGGTVGNASDPAGSDVLAWRLAGGPRHAIRVEGIDIHRAEGGELAPDGRPLVLGGAGRHDLRLSLASHDGRAVVLVRRRGFNREDGTSREHGPPVGNRGAGVRLRAGLRG